MRHAGRILWPLLALLLSLPVSAKCDITGASQTEDDRAAKIPFGRLNISHPAFHPDGTLLASITVPSTQYTFGGAHAGTVLWICDQEDVENRRVYFMVSTNGDSRFGGEFEIGGEGSGIYGTWFEHIGLKQTMAGVTLTRRWQKVPLQSSPPVIDGKVHIRLMDIPPLQADVYWVERHVPASGWYNCGPYPKNKLNSVDGVAYTCNQPASYIQLVGPGIAHDEVNEDHRDYHWDFWWVDNGFGYTLLNGGVLSANPTCVVHSATPHVQFATANVQHLREGGEVAAPFSVVVDCENGAMSGSGSGETAIGLQVSEGAFNAAQLAEPDLVHDGGVEFLLSDRYTTDPGMAKGVGIALYDADDNQRRFVGWPGTVGTGQPRGPLAGWHPVLWGAKLIGHAAPDNPLLQLDFTAKLKQLPGQTATPGKVKATAHVLVKVQ